MSRFSAPSDLDYYGEQDPTLEHCATPGCENHCDIPMSSSWCYECRCKAVLDRARENERHQCEAMAERKRKVG